MLPPLYQISAKVHLCWPKTPIRLKPASHPRSTAGATVAKLPSAVVLKAVVLVILPPLCYNLTMSV